MTLEDQKLHQQQNKNDYLKRMFLDMELFTRILFPDYATDETPEFHREIFNLA